MYVSGYEFYVLANIFTNHAGFQVSSLIVREAEGGDIGL